MMKSIVVKLLPVGAMIACCALQGNAQNVYRPQSSNLAYVYCFDSNGRVVQHCDVTLSSFSYFRRLQHNHNVPPPPLSQLVPTSGNTGTTGLRVMVNTTQVGQFEGVQMCSDLCRVVNFIVAYDLFPLTSGSDWVLIGATTRHPINHYGTLTTLSGIRAVASQYRSEFPDYPVIAINDLSLPLGGIFDLNGNWAGPHYNHSRGKAVDIRGNGRANSVQQIPAVQARFLQICEGNGAIVTLHESKGTPNEHFHCEWP